MSLTGTKIVMIDFTKPLHARRRRGTSPYYYIVPPVGETGPKGFYQSCDGPKPSMDRHGSTSQMRLEWANECLPKHAWLRRTDGYYADEFGDNTMTPIIARLPHGHGFLAGWSMGEGMCAKLERRIYNDEEDAACAAHSIAEYDAEGERGYQARETERLRIEEEEEERRIRAEDARARRYACIEA